MDFTRTQRLVEASRRSARTTPGGDLPLTCPWCVEVLESGEVVDADLSRDEVLVRGACRDHGYVEGWIPRAGA